MAVPITLAANETHTSSIVVTMLSSSSPSGAASPALSLPPPPVVVHNTSGSLEDLDSLGHRRLARGRHYLLTAHRSGCGRQRPTQNWGLGGHNTCFTCCITQYTQLRSKEVFVFMCQLFLDSTEQRTVVYTFSLKETSSICELFLDSTEHRTQLQSSRQKAHLISPLTIAHTTEER